MDTVIVFGGKALGKTGNISLFVSISLLTVILGTTTEAYLFCVKYFDYEFMFNLPLFQSIY
jgi:uncharacterized protein involved in cysteine biosynthesis